MDTLVPAAAVSNTGKREYEAYSKALEAMTYRYERPKNIENPYNPKKRDILPRKMNFEEVIVSTSCFLRVVCQLSTEGVLELKDFFDEKPTVGLSNKQIKKTSRMNLFTRRKMKTCPNRSEKSWVPQNSSSVERNQPIIISSRLTDRWSEVLKTSLNIFSTGNQDITPNFCQHDGIMPIAGYVLRKKGLPVDAPKQWLICSITTDQDSLVVNLLDRIPTVCEGKESPDIFSLGKSGLFYCVQDAMIMRKEELCIENRLSKRRGARTDPDCSAVTPFRCLAVMPPEGGTRTRMGTQNGYTSSPNILCLVTEKRDSSIRLCPMSLHNGAPPTRGHEYNHVQRHTRTPAYGRQKSVADNESYSKQNSARIPLYRSQLGAATAKKPITHTIDQKIGPLVSSALRRTLIGRKSGPNSQR
ncbi:hypothetical protein CLF_110227 [Clonorchis sinensis]|uniref:Uncharacterized protein n=1 Tax=Clonorchis sinensis TaxID=79923 RepID=G7YTA8_CLOSI|nr:hypothetical protein CLF_110227 [Clonorchis sinensis]